MNPRRRRFRRRRNPGNVGSLFKRTFVPYAVGFITSRAMAVVDTGLANYPMVKQVGKVALVAAMRKLLVILNAMVRDRKMWEPATVG